MKKILIAGCALLSITFIQAQQKEGKVTYERVVQQNIQIQGAGMEGIQNMLPRTRKDNFELFFGNNQSLWKQAEKEPEDEVSGEGGMQIRMISVGNDDVLYNNFETGTRVEKRDLFDKTFIIDDSIRPLKWKMTGETKNILNHNCAKATTTQIRQSTQMTVNDGKMERKEISDTSVIVAWFATDIPVAAGPAEYQGQLPGLILEMDIANGRQVFKALDVSPKTDLAVIKPPTGKKRYTPEEFRKERQKMIDDMQRNGGPGIRFRN